MNPKLKAGLIITFLLLSGILYGSLIYLGVLAPTRNLGTTNIYPDVNRFDIPTGVWITPDGETTIVAEKDGTIYSFPNSDSTDDRTTMLDFEDRVNSVGSEDGMLGFAMHPDFDDNHKIYTFHSELIDLKYGDICQEEVVTKCIRTVLSEFTLESRDPMIIDVDSQRELMEFNMTGSWHRAGQIHFGADDYLYVHVGDSTNNSAGKSLDTHLGSILRIDVDSRYGDLPYGIPDDNPFLIDNDNSTLPEIWAYGLRNAWRGSFDPATGDLWVGDVGKDNYEEVNVVRAGEFYGWPETEGYECTYEGVDCQTENTTYPVLAYPHGTLPASNRDDPKGVAIIGGVVYRGELMPELYGKYIFADYSGMIWSVEFDENTYEVIEIKFLSRVVDLITSINTDENGEIILTSFGLGNVLRLEAARPVFFWTFGLLYITAVIATLYYYDKIPYYTRNSVEGTEELSTNET